VAFVSEIEAMARAGSVQPYRTINEKHGVLDTAFLTQFGEERVAMTFVLVGSRVVCSSSFVSVSTALTRALLSFANQNVKHSGDGVQPVLLVVESDHGFVDRNVIR
jgi:hypothetical protein